MVERKPTRREEDALSSLIGKLVEVETNLTRREKGALSSLIGNMFVFLLCQMIEISVMDALELYIGNEKVFRHHNFPDILGLKYDDYSKTKFMKYYLAAKSGFLCAIPLGLTYFLKCGAAQFRVICGRTNIKHIFFMHLIIFIVFLTIDIFNTIHFANNDDMFKVHVGFYKSHIISEIISIICILL